MDLKQLSFLSSSLILGTILSSCDGGGGGTTAAVTAGPQYMAIPGGVPTSVAPETAVGDAIPFKYIKIGDYTRAFPISSTRIRVELPGGGYPLNAIHPSLPYTYEKVGDTATLKITFTAMTQPEFISSINTTISNSTRIQTLLQKGKSGANGIDVEKLTNNEQNELNQLISDGNPSIIRESFTYALKNFVIVIKPSTSTLTWNKYASRFLYTSPVTLENRGPDHFTSTKTVEFIK